MNRFFIFMALSCGVMVVGCGEEDSPTTPRTMTRPAQATGVDRAAEQREQSLAQQAAKIAALEPVPPVGEATPTTMPDGQVWQLHTSGLAIRREKEGAGPTPKVGQTVHMKYVLRLPNGKVVERSTDKPLPFELGTTGVISGWNLAASMMKVGDKASIWLPASLGYGERGKMPTIMPNQALIFDLEMIDITGDGYTSEEIAQARATTQAAAEAAKELGKNVPPPTTLKLEPMGPEMPTTQNGVKH